MLPAQPQQDAAYVAKELSADARVAESLQIVAELPPDDLIEQAARTLIRTAVHQAVKRKKGARTVFRCTSFPMRMRRVWAASSHLFSLAHWQSV